MLYVTAGFPLSQRVVVRSTHSTLAIGVSPRLLVTALVAAMLASSALSSCMGEASDVRLLWHGCERKGQQATFVGQPTVVPTQLHASIFLVAADIH